MPARADMGGAGTVDVIDQATMTQDVRLTPNGREFYVADMMSDGLWILDGTTMHVTGHIDTGVGTHGIYPSRDTR